MHKNYWLLVLLLGLGVQVVLATSNIWNFDVPSQYGFSDPSILEVSGGNSHLVEAANPVWFDNEYVYRTRIQVTASPASALPLNYSVSATVNVKALLDAGKLLANGNDFRLVYWNAANSRYERFNGSIWVEDVSKEGLDVIFETQSGNAYPDNNSVKVWFPLAKALATSEVDDNYFIYYGNPGETTAPLQDGNKVFQFYDGFDGASLDPSVWDLSQAGSTFTTTGGELLTNNSNYRVKTFKTFTYPVKLETEFISHTTPTNGVQSIGFWTSTTDGIGLLSHSTPDYVRNNNAWTNLGLKHTDGQAHFMELTAISSTQVRLFTKNLVTQNTVMNNVLYTNTVSGEAITLGLRYDNSMYGQVADSRWRYIRARAFVSNEPIVAAQSEQPHYSQQAPYVYPLLGESISERIVSFGATTMEPVGTGVRFCVSADNGSTWKFFNVDQWSTSNCSYVQASLASDISANAAGLGTGTFLYRALLYSQDGVLTPQLDAVTLVVNDLPGAFTLTTPATGTEWTALTGTLAWNASADSDPEDIALSYRIQIDDDAAFGSPLVDKSIGNVVSYAVIAGDNLADNATYYWRVIAKDSHNDSAISNVHTLYTNTVLQDPTIVSVGQPIGTELDGSGQLSWTVSDPDPNESFTYEIQIDNNSNFGSMEVNQINLAGTTITLSSLTGYGNLVDDGIYYWKVRAKDKTGRYSPYSSATNTFFFNTVNDVPVAPTLTAPPNGTTATIVPTTAFTFTTTDADSKGLTPDTHTFTIDISSVNTFAAIVGTTVGATSGILLNQMTGFGSLVNGTTYYWRARAVDNHGATSGNSSTRSFRYQLTNNPPTPTNLANVPTDSIYRSATNVEWLLSTDPDSGNTVTYRVEAELTDTTTGTRELTANRTAAQGTFAALSTLIAANTTGSTVASTFDNQYYWVRVRAFDVSGNFSTGSTWRRVKFNTVALATPDITTVTTVPQNNVVFTVLQPTLDWDDLATTGGVPTSYSMEYATNGSMTGSQRISVVPSTVNLASEAVTLVDNTTYSWRVRAYDGFGDSTVSTIRTFHVNLANEDPTVPASFNIVDGTERVATDSLGWMSTDPDPTDVLTYDIQVDNNADFSSPEINQTNVSLAKVRISDLTGAGSLVDNGKYYWKVRACDNHAACSPYSTATRYFIYNPVNDAPATPTIASPADAATLTAADAFVFSTTDPDNQGTTPDVPTFTVEVSQNAGFTAVISTTLGAASGIKVGELDNAASFVNTTTYYWRVTARDPHGALSSPTVGQSFLYQSTNSPPIATQFINVPADSLFGLASMLEWNVSTDPDVGNTVSYRVEFETDTLTAVRELTASLSLTSRSIADLITANTTGSTASADFDNQRFYARVRAVDNTGFPSNFSAWKRIKLNTVALAQVNLSSGTTEPLNNATVANQQPSLNWDDLASSGGIPTQYTVELSTAIGFGSPTRIQTGSSDMSLAAQAITLPDNSVRYWRVWAHDDFGDSSLSVIDSFSVNLANEDPAMTGALNIVDGTERIASDSLGWSATDPDPHTVLLYEIQVDEDAGFNSPEILQSGISASKVRISNLTGAGSLVDDGLYYWKVRACDEFLVCSPFTSASHYFIYNPVNDVPLAPQLTSPADGAVAIQTSSLAFSATDADTLGATPDVLTYNIEISQNSGFTSVVSTTLGVSSGVLLNQLNNTGSLVNGTTYYWRVYARDQHGSVSLASSTQVFIYQTTNTAPTVTNLMSVPADSIYRLNSQMQWSLSSDVDPGNTISYQIIATLDTNAGTPDLTASRTGTSTTVASLIAANTTGSTIAASFDNQRYYVKVRAIDNTGFASAYSAWRLVKLNTVDLATVNLATGMEVPLSGSVLANTQPSFDWTDLNTSGGAPASYDLEVATTTTFASSYRLPTVVSSLSFASAGQSLTDNRVYYWRVWARDQFGDSTVSAFDSLIVNVGNDAPGIPLPLSIANGTERRLVDSLGWTGVDVDPKEILTYNLRVSADPNFAFAAISLNGLPQTRYPLSSLSGSGNLVENGKYYWAVQSRDQSGALSAYTSPDSFFFFNNVNEAPSTPANLSPIAGAVVTNADYLRFSSTDADAIGATPDVWTYTVEIARDSAYNAIISTTSGISFDSVLVGTLQNVGIFQNDSTYYWRVWAVDPHGLRSDTTEIRRFLYLQLNTAPTATAWVTPDEGVLITGTTPIRWTRSTDAEDHLVKYLLEARTDTISALNLLVAIVTDTSHTLNSLIAVDTLATGSASLDDRVLFMRLRAYDPYGASTVHTPWRRVLTNTADDVPTATTFVRPTQGVTVQDAAGFSWEPSYQPDLLDTLRYLVQIAKDSAFAQIMTSAIVPQTDTSIAITAMTGYQWLIPDSSYFVRLRVSDLAGQTPGWTTPVRFVLGTANSRPSAPSVIFPKNAQVLQPTNLLTWTPSTDGDGTPVEYEILVSLASSAVPVDSTQALYSVRGIQTTSYDVRQIPGYRLWKDSTQYRWSIRAYDPLKYHSASDTATFRFVSSAPEPPEVIGPKDSAQALPTSPLLWHPALDVDAGPEDSLRYVIEVDTSDLFQTILIRDTVSDTSQLIQALPGQQSFDNNDTLVWRVRSLDVHGKIGVYSTPRIFIFNRGNEAPLPPLVQGLQEDSLLYTFQNLHWQGRDPNNLDIALLRYRVQVSTTTGFGSLRADSSNILATQVALDQMPGLVAKLKAGSTYYWRVMATDTGGLTSDWSEPVKFKLRSWTDKLLDVPLVLDGSGTVVYPEDTLAWNIPTYNRVRYEVLLTSLDSTIRDTLRLDGVQMDSLGIARTTVSMIASALGSQFQPNHYYWWQLRALDTLYGKVGSFSKPEHFYLGDSSFADSRQMTAAWIVDRSGKQIHAADELLSVIVPDSAFENPVSILMRELPELDVVDLASLDSTTQRHLLSVDTAHRYTNADRSTRPLGQKKYMIEARDLRSGEVMQPADSHQVELRMIPLHLDTVNGMEIVRYETPGKPLIKRDYDTQMLAFYRLDEDRKRWARQSGSQLVTGKTLARKAVSATRHAKTSKAKPYVSLQSDHFSIYTLMAANPSNAAFSDFLVYPSPVKLSSPAYTLNHARISYMISEPTHIQISIYSRTGGLVWRHSQLDRPTGSKSEVLWDGRNLDHALVGNGYYVVHITAKPQQSGGVHHVKQVIAVYK